MVSLIVGTTRLTKVLIDGGSGLNILYASTLDRMGIPRSSLRPSKKGSLTFEVVDFPGVYHSLLARPCFAKFMAIPNYTYLKLKILVEGSFEQAYYCEQDYITQAATLFAPYGLTDSSHDIGKAPAKEGTKTVAAPDRPSVGEAPRTASGSGGSAGPSIQALGPIEGADLIEVSSDLSL
ncbi:uncharacterized protein [Miscanthus floridulus]|uniref:uncharacterized protein n=1 Tax=Miscanthus floridulus TaxID=154761 RepID=UPI00345A8DB4